METPRVLIRPAPPYEPPIRSVEVDGSPDRPTPSPAGARRRNAPDRSSAQAVEARRFAVGTVTLVLEVLDRRRGVNQLDGVVTQQLLAELTALARVHGPVRPSSGALPQVVENAATLRRVHVQMRGPGTAEVFGSCRRGERVRAFAARIEQLPCRVRGAPGHYRPGLPRNVEYRWQLVDFTLV
ncbi:Rv3235 family protein [Gordonia sp. SL306]|uniref:Rv3235 family protein n=1 Tax=Gordonia sp. SL306 TaxID=2995145 RepID=UPI002270F21C|nr:Rv3235 family protein [Gordonia sp. SL306]WAC56402.1 Rv3235 family protein [Gordonia sp. SL306]